MERPGTTRSARTRNIRLVLVTMIGASGVVAVYGAGCLLACAIIAISGVVAGWLAALIAGVALLAAAGAAVLPGRMRKAAPSLPGQAAAGVRADVKEIKERAHR
jgi:uncharacterized membrane protein